MHILNTRLENSHYEYIWTEMPVVCTGAGVGYGNWAQLSLSIHKGLLLGTLQIPKSVDA